MRRLRPCCGFRSAKRWLLWLAVGALLVRLPQSARAADLELLVAPPAQATNQTCQAYVLAVALSMLDTSKFTSPAWRVNDKEGFRLNEMTIRGAIVQQMQQRLKRKPKPSDDSTRDDWKAAIKQLTFGQFALGQKTFLSLTDMIQFLETRLPIRSKVNPLAPLLISSPATLYFTSVRRIEHSLYKGHIVSIAGIHRPPDIKTPAATPELLLINSAAKGDDNECLPPEVAEKRWFGTASWTMDYEVKDFDGKYVLNWLESTD